MKKIKTLNKLLSSLTLLSPLVGIGFNNQYQNIQTIVTENTKNYINDIEETEEQMGEVKVRVQTDTVTGYRKITGYISGSGSGALIISNDIDEIGYRAFSSGANITSLDLSNATKLKVLNEGIFWDHKELTGNIVIPSGVTTIKFRAFYGTDITSLDLSQATSLTTIDTQTFGNCEYLKSFLPPPSSNKNFSLASNLGPKNQVLITGADDLWKDESVSAGSLAFGDIILPSTIKTISDYAFQFTNITSLDLSQATSLTTIGNNAFIDCKNLTGDLVIPSSVISIRQHAFQYNTNIISLDLSNATSLTSIGDDTFTSCTNLTGDITIPSSVTSIGGYAFNHCSIQNLIFRSEIPPTSFGFNWQPTLNGKVYVPEGTKNTKF